MSYLVKKKLPLLALRVIDFVLSSLHKKATFGKLEKLLLCNIAHLGDAVIATTLLPVLKEALPHIKIGFLSCSSSACVVQGHPDLTWLHTLDHWKLNRGRVSKSQKILTYYATKTKAIHEIANIGYDAAIDLYPFFPNAIPVLWKTKIPIRIGYRSGGFGPLLTHPLDWQDRQQYMAEYHLTLLRQLPVEISQKPLRYSLPSHHGYHHPNLEKEFIIFHMGSGAEQKHWSETAWRELAMGINDRQIVFTGKGAVEHARIERVKQGLSHGLNLCDQLGWQDFCSVVSQASQIISVDSVIVHLAAALAAPCLVIIVDGSNNHLLWTPPGTPRLVQPLVDEVIYRICKS